MNSGLWPRTRLFQTHGPLPPMPQTWSVSSRLTFLPSQAGGSSLNPSWEPGEIQSAGLANMLSSRSAPCPVMPIGCCLGLACWCFRTVSTTHQSHFCLAALVDHFVQHVVEFVDRVDHLADVGGLKFVRPPDWTGYALCRPRRCR